MYPRRPPKTPQSCASRGPAARGRAREQRAPFAASAASAVPSRAASGADAACAAPPRAVSAAHAAPSRTASAAHAAHAAPSRAMEVFAAPEGAAADVFLQFFEQWHQGFVEDPETYFQDLVARFGGHHLPLSWPPNHRITVGNIRRFKIRPDRQAGLRDGFRDHVMYRGQGWFHLLGLIHDAAATPTPGTCPWAVVGGGKAVFAYIPKTNVMYKLCESGVLLEEMGVRNAEWYYELPGAVTPEHERLWYGYELGDDLRKIMVASKRRDPYGVLVAVRKYRGTVCESYKDGHVLTLGPEGTPGVNVPKAVADALRLHCLYVLGSHTKYGSICVYCALSKHVYVMLTASKLLKVADSVISFVRQNLRILDQKTPCCSVGCSRMLQASGSHVRDLGDDGSFAPPGARGIPLETAQQVFGDHKMERGGCHYTHDDDDFDDEDDYSDCDVRSVESESSHENYGVDYDAVL